jgi:hypothetical protein
MIFSENRYPLFGIMLGAPCPMAAHGVNLPDWTVGPAQDEG